MFGLDEWSFPVHQLGKCKMEEWSQKSNLRTRAHIIWLIIKVVKPMPKSRMLHCRLGHKSSIHWLLSGAEQPLYSVNRIFTTFALLDAAGHAMRWEIVRDVRVTEAVKLQVKPWIHSSSPSSGSESNYTNAIDVVMILQHACRCCSLYLFLWH